MAGVVAQLPAPSQNACSTAVLVAGSQLAAKHSVWGLGNTQALRWVPLQAPVQTEPSPLQALRSPWGSPSTAVQAPALP